MNLASGFDPHRIPPALVLAMLSAVEETAIHGTTPKFQEISEEALFFTPYDGNSERIAQGMRERLNQHYAVSVEVGGILVSVEESA